VKTNKTTAAAVKTAAVKTVSRKRAAVVGCSKCGRNNERPTSPDCRNGAACKSRRAEQRAAARA